MNHTAVTEYISTATEIGKNQVDPNAITFRYFGISVAVYAIIVGTIGNLLTILAFLSNKKLQTTFNVFVVNLSIVDFITSAFMLPFHVAGYVQMQWPFGNDSVTTRLQAFFYFSCGYTSIVFLVAITINRFIGVFWPTQYDHLFQRRGMVMVLLICWTFAPACLLPSLVGTNPLCPDENKALTGYLEAQFLCTFRPVCVRNGWKVYMQWLRVMFQFLPLGVMAVVYAAIFAKMQKNARSMSKRTTLTLRAMRLSSAVSVTSTSPSKRLSPSKRNKCSSKKLLEPPKKPAYQRKTSNVDLKRAQNNRRMLLISVVICIAFMITFQPSVIINLLPGSRDFDTRIHMAASNLTWFNSSLNPIIYVILNARFRREYIRLIKMLFGKAKGRFWHDSSFFTMKSRYADHHAPQSNARNI